MTVEHREVENTGYSLRLPGKRLHTTTRRCRVEYEYILTIVSALQRQAALNKMEAVCIKIRGCALQSGVTRRKRKRQFGLDSFFIANDDSVPITHSYLYTTFTRPSK